MLLPAAGDLRVAQLVKEAEEGMEGAESVTEESASGVGTSHGDNDGVPSDKEAGTATRSNSGSGTSLDETSTTTGGQSVGRKVPLLLSSL